MEKKALSEQILKYLTEPYYPEKSKIEDFNLIFSTMQSAISKENFRLAQHQANNKTPLLRKRSTNTPTYKKSKSTQRINTETIQSNNSNINTTLFMSIAKSNFELQTDDNNQIKLKRIEGKKPIASDVVQRKKEMLFQILTERSYKIQNGPSDFTLKPKIQPKQFYEVPISSSINRFQYQYTTTTTT